MMKAHGVSQYLHTEREMLSQQLFTLHSSLAKNYSAKDSRFIVSIRLMLFIVLPQKGKNKPTRLIGFIE